MNLACNGGYDRTIGGMKNDEIYHRELSLFFYLFCFIFSSDSGHLPAGDFLWPQRGKTPIARRLEILGSLALDVEQTALSQADSALYFGMRGRSDWIACVFASRSG